MKEVILSGGDLGGQVVEVDDNQQEIIINNYKYRVINGQAVFEVLIG